MQPGSFDLTMVPVHGRLFQPSLAYDAAAAANED